MHEPASDQPTNAVAEPFLSLNRLIRIGTINAHLLLAEKSFINRRKETNTILDETALHRQVSVDFTLPDAIPGVGDPWIKQPTSGERVYLPPLFVLPKQKRNLMAFDVVDETRRALPLMTRKDNAAISAHTLVAMAKQISERQIPGDLQAELHEIAAADHSVERRAERFLSPLPGDSNADVRRALAKNNYFAWWVRTLAHSSIVGVPCRDVAVRRRIVKLSFLAPLVHDLPLLSRIGLSTYDVVIDSSWAEGRTFHYEAEAPRGLRVTYAAIRDNEGGDEERKRGFQRRVHLYRTNADHIGPSTATLQLRVSGHGFIGGAVLAALLALGGLIACYFTRSAIASNPTSAPALLLLVPGLIASYVGRPDQHALTTRLLSAARAMLLATAGVSYAVAAVIALSGKVADHEPTHSHRVAELQWPLLGAILVVGLCAGFLSLAFVLGRPWLGDVELGMTIRRVWRAATATSFTLVEPVSLHPEQTLRQLDDGQLEWLLGIRSELLLRRAGDERRGVAPHSFGDQLMVCSVLPSDEGSLVVCRVDVLASGRQPVISTLVLRRERIALRARLDELPTRLGAA